MVQIVTDHKWKNFSYADEVPDKVLARQFDYQNRDEVCDGFFKYRGHWYHLDDFMLAPASLKPWDGYAGDSFFSGIVIRVSPDGEQYQAGLYLS